MITIKTEVEKIRVFDADNALLNYIVDKIWTMDMEHEDCEYTGMFDFEVETSDERLIFLVKGTINVYGYTEDDTNSFIVESVSSNVLITADYDGEVVDFQYNELSKLELEMEVENELQIKR